jgi:hypothetical protein
MSSDDVFLGNYEEGYGSGDGAGFVDGCGSGREVGMLCGEGYGDAPGYPVARRM